MDDDGQLTIGEFARRTGLSVSALRFYDRVGVLVPADVDPQSSYRRYDGAQVDDGRLVRDLRRLELPLAAIVEHLADPDPARRRRRIDAHLRTLTARLESARAIARDLQEAAPTMSTDTTTTVDRRALAAAIDQVTPAASTDPEFPFLHTVLVEVRDGTLRLVATDRYRLAVRDLVVGGDGPAFRAVVAAAALDRVRRSLAGTDAVDDVDVHLAEHHLVIGQERVPRQPTEFPEYEKLLTPDDGPPSRSALVDRAALQDLVSTASGAAVVTLSFADGRVSLDGDAGRSVPATYEGDPPPTVGLHPRFVAAALDAAVGPEVLVEVVAPERPVVFRSATDSSYVCMVMPIKLR